MRRVKALAPPAAFDLEFEANWQRLAGVGARTCLGDSVILITAAT